MLIPIGILFSLEEKENPIIDTNMDVPKIDWA